MAGRATPLMRPMRRRADAMVAPVLPADSMALALPSRTSSAARTSDESFLRRTDPPGSSFISMTSVHSNRSRPRVSRTRSRGPTRRMGTPSSSAGRRARATISPGALSPPTASTATGSIPTSCWLDDVDDLAAAVVAAGGADDVRQLGRAAVRAQAPARHGQLPVGGPTAPALHLAGLLLGDGPRPASSL